MKSIISRLLNRARHIKSQHHHTISNVQPASSPPWQSTCNASACAKNCGTRSTSNHETMRGPRFAIATVAEEHSVPISG